MKSLAGEAAQSAAADEVRRVNELLRRRISRLGLSQKEVERRLGWGEGYLSQILTGKVDLKFQHFFRLAENLDFAVSDFFTELYSEGQVGERRVGDPLGPVAPSWSVAAGQRELAERNPEAFRELVGELVREVVQDLLPASRSQAS